MYNKGKGVDTMKTYILVISLIYIFSSLGVFIKLRKYGAPLSSFLYSGVIPIAAMIFTIKFGYNNIIKSEGKNNIINRIMDFLRFQCDCLKRISVITGLFCLDIGRMQISAFDLVEHFFEKISDNIISMENVYSEIIHELFVFNKKSGIVLKRI